MKKIIDFLYFFFPHLGRIFHQGKGILYFFYINLYQIQFKLIGNGSLHDKARNFNFAGPNTIQVNW